MQWNDTSKVAKKRVEENGGKVVEVEKGKSIDTSEEKPPFCEFQPCVPYPTRVKKNHTNEIYKKFMDLLKQAQFNLLFADALSEMLKYAKFLKDLLTN